MTKYKLRKPVGWSSSSTPDGPAFVFRLLTFEDIALGEGSSLEHARRDLEAQLHRKFQRLVNVPERKMAKFELETWLRLKALIDVEEYRQRQPLISKQIGRIVKLHRIGKYAQWEDGLTEFISYTKAPGTLATFSKGSSFEAVVNREPKTFRLLRIQWLSRYDPPPELDPQEEKRLADSIPTIEVLPEGHWD